MKGVGKAVPVFGRQKPCPADEGVAELQKGPGDEPRLPLFIEVEHRCVLQERGGQLPAQGDEGERGGKTSCGDRSTLNSMVVPSCSFG